MSSYFVDIVDADVVNNCDWHWSIFTWDDVGLKGNHPSLSRTSCRTQQNGSGDMRSVAIGTCVVSVIGRCIDETSIFFCYPACLCVWNDDIKFWWWNTPTIRTTERHKRYHCKIHCFPSGREGGNLSAWQRMMARAGCVHINCDWWYNEQHWK